MINCTELALVRQALSQSTGGSKVNTNSVILLQQNIEHIIQYSVYRKQIKDILEDIRIKPDVALIINQIETDINKVNQLYKPP